MVFLLEYTYIYIYIYIYIYTHTYIYMNIMKILFIYCMAQCQIRMEKGIRKIVLCLFFDWKTICWLYLWRDVRDPSNECPEYITLNHLMVRPQCWSFNEYRVPCYCHYFQVHFDLLVVVLVNLSSMVQIETIQSLTRLAISCVQTND